MKRIAYSRALGVLPLAAVAAGFAVHNAGCAKDDPPATVQQSVAIGFSVDLSGTNGQVGDALRKGAQTAIDLVNARGGVLGRPIVLDVKDDKGNNSAKSDQGKALREIIQGFVDQKVAAILGPSSSVQFVDAQKIAFPTKTLMMSAWSTSAEVTTEQPAYPDRYLYRTVPSDSFQSRALWALMTQGTYGSCSGGGGGADAGTDAGASGQRCCKPYYVYADDPLGRSYKAYLDGKQATGIVVPTTAQADFTSAINAIAGPKPDCIAFTTYADVAGAIIPQLVTKIKNSGNWPYTLFGTDATNTQNFINYIKARDATFSSIEGMVGVVPNTAPSQSASYSAFERIFRASQGEAPAAYAANAFDAAILLALAVQKAGTATDPVKIRDALVSVSRGYGGPKQETKPSNVGSYVSPESLGEAFSIIKQGGDIDYDGASGPVDFDDRGDVAGSYTSWRINKTGAFEDPGYKWDPSDLPQ